MRRWAQRADHDQIWLTGDGLKKYRAQFEAAGFSRFVDEGAWHPTGEGLLRAAAASGVAFGKSDAAVDSGDPALVLPVYTRLSDAEENEAKVWASPNRRPLPPRAATMPWQTVTSSSAP